MEKIKSQIDLNSKFVQFIILLLCCPIPYITTNIYENTYVKWQKMRFY